MYFRIVHYLFFCFGLNLLISSSHVHKFLNVKLDKHTPFVYIMFKIGMKNKQYGISFEVVTSLQLSCKSKTFFMPYFFNF
jgi:hypothetical protein